MKTLISVIFVSISILGCSTALKKERPEPGISQPAPPFDEPAAISVDYPALQNSLQMERSREALGFAERVFNTCDVGYGYSSSKNCHKENFVVIHLRLQCRDSEGTISTVLTEQDLRPLDRRNVRWSLKGAQGVIQTDGDGYGQIITASTNSQKNQRIRLAIGSEFLYMRTNEIKKVITPKPWCDLY